MPKTIEQLSALKVTRLTSPGLYADGNGLYLQVTAGRGRSWVFRYSLDGRSREMGLGSCRKVRLDEARRKATEYGKVRDEGKDPIDERARAVQDQRLERSKSLTLSEGFAQYVRAHTPGWKNSKHAAQWATTFAAYVEPALGALPVRAIDAGHVVRVLEPIWTTKPETASRVRGRLEAVLDWAKVHGYRTGDNPARWRGHLDNVFPAKSKLRVVKHHAAMPYDELPEFMAALRAQEGAGARALEFTILTAARTSETTGAVPDEISEQDSAWTIPACRMKGGRDHRVPLSARALQIARDSGGGRFLFPGQFADRPLSNMAMAKVLERMGIAYATVHGFRSTFKDWARDRTNFPNELSEAALAHAIGDKTEAAYARGTMFEKRRRLMLAWTEFANDSAQVGGQVMPLRREA